MFEVQFRRIINEASKQGVFRKWYELGHFINVPLAMNSILVAINGHNNTNLKTEDFIFSHYSEEWLVLELPGFSDRISSVWQFRFVEVKAPDSPWKIGLNDND